MKIWIFLYPPEEPTTARGGRYRRAGRFAFADHSRPAPGGEHAKRLARYLADTLHCARPGLRLGRRLPRDLHVRDLAPRRQDVGRSYSI